MSSITNPVLSFWKDVVKRVFERLGRPISTTIPGIKYVDKILQFLTNLFF